MKEIIGLDQNCLTRALSPPMILASVWTPHLHPWLQATADRGRAVLAIPLVAFERSRSGCSVQDSVLALKISIVFSSELLSFCWRPPKAKVVCPRTTILCSNLPFFIEWADVLEVFVAKSKISSTTGAPISSCPSPPVTRIEILETPGRG